MACKIHSTAIVDPKAVIGDEVEVGAYAVIGPRVTIGRGTKILNHAALDGRTQIGERCLVYPGACLGGDPQVKKKGVIPAGLVIGDDNIFREHVTVSTAMLDHSNTVIGDRNYLMAGVHVAHDCTVGSDVTIANGTVFSGHVTVEDQVTISGLVGVHQFVRIGKLSMIGGLSKLVADAPPFSICDGHPARFYGINSVGLRRAGVSSKDALILRKILRTLLKPGVEMSKEIPAFRKEYKGNDYVEYLIAFLEKSERGVCRVE